MKIIVDGDSQPSKKEIIETGIKNGIEVVIVLSVSHFSEKPELKEAQLVIVDNRKQEADIKIMNLAKTGDIAITGDTGLGLFLASKGLYVINSKGRILNEKDLDIKFQELHIEKKIRRGKTGKFLRIKGPHIYRKEDKDRLIRSIEKIIFNNKNKDGEQI